MSKETQRIVRFFSQVILIGLCAPAIIVSLLYVATNPVVHDIMTRYWHVPISVAYGIASMAWTVHAERRFRAIKAELRVLDLSHRYLARTVNDIEGYLEKGDTDKMQCAPIITIKKKETT